MIKTIGQFRKKYFPNSYKKEKEANMSPEELGKEWAKDTMREIRKILWE